MYYLAGPMTGLPDFNYPAFREACRVLRRSGYRVRSSHEIFEDEITNGSPERPWWDYRTKALRLMMHCTDIIMLPGWEMSAGATLEKVVARGLGMGSYIYEFNSTRQMAILRLDRRGLRDIHDDWEPTTT